MKEGILSLFVGRRPKKNDFSTICSLKIKIDLKNLSFCQKSYSFVHYLENVSNKIVYKYQYDRPSRFGEHVMRTIKKRSRLL